MRPLIQTLPPGQPDPEWLHRLLIVERVCLALVALLSLVTLADWLFPSLDPSLHGLVSHWSPATAAIALAAVIGLALTDPANRPATLYLGRLFAVVPFLLAALTLVMSILVLSPGPDFFLELNRAAARPASPQPQSVAALLLLSIVLLLIRNDSEFARHASDIVVACLGLVALVLVSQDLFGVLGLFNLAPGDLVAPQVLCVVVLLSMVIVLRQAEFGVFSIFVGCGIGSRIARGFAPILLLWPFLREIGVAQMGILNLLPAHFAPSLITAFAVAFSLALLLVLVWRVNEMEKEIHDLTLRDELTGLYNMNGFYLLAEQTQRLAQRAQQPFSVLFLDLDGLKQINDSLGHNAGSAYLAETGAIIHANFRNADVKGRFGGDEFVVAGQFSAVGIELAAVRLRAMAADRNAKSNRQFPLSFSVGYVTAEHYSNETLRQLVARADELMYEDKRQRKMARG